MVHYKLKASSTCSFATGMPVAALTIAATSASVTWSRTMEPVRSESCFSASSSSFRSAGRSWYLSCREARGLQVLAAAS